MADHAVTVLASLTGLCFLVLSLVILAVKGKGDRAVTWRGLGVTFEIKPCNTCTKRR